ncbi:unnamed protein product [Spirodela intermedia]|uniref:Uncharacterized protein n=1 Tax=Spirodela intermedia TaxID=51605 RepID=A0A7I8IE97_SPIIN|nr:unnamed protein product [Spirodela intermedia]CAA6655423.1 unnamed protein product [Spirodela intermedia]
MDFSMKVWRFADEIKQLLICQRVF